MIFNVKQKGFTLIELLVVIAIIGLLASIVLASLNIAREKAQWSAFMQETKQIMTAIEMYVADHDGDYMSLVRGGPWGNINDNYTEAIEGLMYIVIYKLVPGGYMNYNPDYARGIVKYTDYGPEYDSVPVIDMVINYDFHGCNRNGSPYFLSVFDTAIDMNIENFGEPWVNAPFPFSNHYCLKAITE